jgi:hypothetical protein
MLEAVRSDWFPKELELEKWIFEGDDEDRLVLREDIFGERFLRIARQARTQNAKRADIIALDRRGNGVIVELKRDKGHLGVETQALQYLAAFAPLKGRAFVEHFANSNDVDKLMKAFKAFVDDGVGESEINLRSRVVLVAQDFDPSLFSMGKWLGECGVAFKCVQFTTFRVREEYLVSFSIQYEHSPFNLHPLEFRKKNREPKIFWHNIGINKQEWWNYLREKGEIPTGFDNEPGDEGERILKNYIKGDRVVAYAKGYGALGWAKVENPAYRLIPEGSPEADKGYHRHRLKVSWQACASSIKNGIPSRIFEARTNVYHPIQTCSGIDPEGGEVLIRMLQEKFSSK